MEHNVTNTQRDNIGYAIVILLSCIFLIWVIPTYTPPYPGYGVSTSLLPNVAVGAILFLAGLGLVRNLLAARLSKKNNSVAEEEACRPADAIHWLHIARFFIPCALLLPAMAYIGFIPAGIIFMVILQYFCGQRKPFTMALVAVIPVLIVYAAMRWALGVPMP